jgi:hypothetical protein
VKCSRLGVTLRYPLRGGLSRDPEVIARARRAVPRLPKHPDTGAGPFGGRRAPMRDISMDFWTKSCGLTPKEVAALKNAFKGTDVKVDVRKINCCEIMR